MIKEILKTIQLNGLTWSGTDKKTANVPAGNDFVFNVNNLPEFSETYPNPEEFTILYKDESNVMRQLTCTNVSNGVTKYIFAYKIDNDVINLSIFKSDGHLEINIRNNKLEYPINLDSVEFQVKYDDGEQPTPGDDELIDDTYEIKLRSTTTFNRYAIVDTEVTMKKPDDKAVNYVADEAVVKVNGVEVSGGGGGYPEPTGTIEITENGTANVKDYAEANVNVPTYPEPAGTITITENGTVNVKDYAEASVNVSGSAPTGTIEITENGTYDVSDKAEANVNVSSYKETLLWENPNPNQSFPQTQIPGVSITDYDALKFILRSDATAAVFEDKENFILKDNMVNDIGHILYPFPMGNSYWGRKVINSSSYLEIQVCTSGSGYVSGAANFYCVPIAIYGVKF